MQQLLLIETIIKLVAGGLLLVIPLTTAKVFGLSQPPTAFWPRLLGGILIGLAAATYIETHLTGSRGLGLGGIIAINLAAAATIAGQLIMKSGADTKRGRITLWFIAALLTALALFEIAFV